MSDDVSQLAHEFDQKKHRFAVIVSIITLLGAAYGIVQVHEQIGLQTTAIENAANAETNAKTAQTKLFAAEFKNKLITDFLAVDSDARQGFYEAALLLLAQEQDDVVKANIQLASNYMKEVLRRQESGSGTELDGILSNLQDLRILLLSANTQERRNARKALPDKLAACKDEACLQYISDILQPQYLATSEEYRLALGLADGLSRLTPGQAASIYAMNDDATREIRSKLEDLEDAVDGTLAAAATRALNLVP